LLSAAVMTQSWAYFIPRIRPAIYCLRFVIDMFYRG